MERRTLLKAGVLAPVAAAVSEVALTAPAQAVPSSPRTLASGLDYPWGVGFLRGGDALVTERNSGRVLRVSASGGATEVGTIPGVFNNGGEGGLLGLAISPTFSSDQWVYLYVTTEDNNRVIRVKYVGGELGTAEVVLGGIPRNQTHNGGGLLFHDSSLFVTTGDNRHPERAQNRSSRAGKILRIKTDGTAQDGNPFGTRVFSYGHRNVEGIAVASDGRIWASELGENTWDELNHIRAGHNYGWAKVEGSDGPGGYTNPFVQWHTDVCSPSGIALAHGKAFVGALRGECLWRVDLEGRGARTKTRYFFQRFGRIRNVKRAPDGTLWLTTSNGENQDKVIRVTLT